MGTIQLDALTLDEPPSPKKVSKFSNEDLLEKFIVEFESSPLREQEPNIKVINDLCDLCSKDYVSDLALKARANNLKRASQVLILNLITRNQEPGPDPKSIIFSVIRHPQEMMDLLRLYLRNGRQPFSKHIERGLAKCFSKFSEKEFKQCSNSGPVKLRDVLAISHAKPNNEERARLYNRIARNRL